MEGGGLVNTNEGWGHKIQIWSQGCQIANRDWGQGRVQGRGPENTNILFTQLISVTS